jgi:hypothetical protein
LASITQVPLALVIVTVALVTPPATLGAPTEQVPVLARSTVNVTVNPELDCAVTTGGVASVIVIVWLAF